MGKHLIFLMLFFSIPLYSQQTVEDNFEGNGTITSWFGDDCNLDTQLTNPYQQGINLSSTVLQYSDNGGQYANVYFDTDANFDLSTDNVFTLKIYISSSSLTGSQPNQVSLKLQNKNLGAPWSTQSEIIKSVTLDQWQEVTFDFANDAYVNLDPNSDAPINRADFNRVLLQINGEDNNNHVTAYIDDFSYNGTLDVPVDPVYDNLVWADEFDGDGAIDAAKWHHQTLLPNGNSWYNGEIQHYTNREENSSVSSGFLKIVAKKESFTDQGVTKEYTSARLNSKFAFTYGRVAVRAKLPIGGGTWPAIWMLGKNINEPGGYWADAFGTVNWPACGEIDIMEHWGDNQNYVQSAMHTPSSFGGTINKGGQVVPTASTSFHLYELIWTPERMVFSVDGVEHYVYHPNEKNSNTWPFDSEQYVLLNIAIESDIDASFTESAMEIDYIRVYQESALSIDQTEIDKLLLFPNPVQDELRIKVPVQLIGNSVFVYTMTGVKVDSFTLNNNLIVADWTRYSQGIYFIMVETNSGYKVYKVLKKGK